MKCSGCQAENREGARFCRACGALFAGVCPGCGASVEAGSKFCDRCGIPLASAATAESSPAHAGQVETMTGDVGELISAPTASAERRQLTVMFCDLVGSTELAARLDPEVLRDVVRSYQHVCDRVMGPHHGTVAQYLGDGVPRSSGFH